MRSDAKVSQDGKLDNPSSECRNQILITPGGFSPVMFHTQRGPPFVVRRPRGGADGPIILTRDQVSRPKQGRHFRRNAASNGHQLQIPPEVWHVPLSNSAHLVPPPPKYSAFGLLPSCIYNGGSVVNVSVRSRQNN